MKDVVKINFNGEEFEIKKIPMRRFPQLAAALNDIPAVVVDVFSGANELGELDTSALLEKAPTIIMQASETLPPLLAVASNIDLETVLDGGLDDFVGLISAVLEINNFETIVKYLKNMMPTQK